MNTVFLLNGILQKIYSLWSSIMLVKWFESILNFWSFFCRCIKSYWSNDQWDIAKSGLKKDSPSCLNIGPCLMFLCDTLSYLLVFSSVCYVQTFIGHISINLYVLVTVSLLCHLFILGRFLNCDDIFKIFLCCLVSIRETICIEKLA